MTIRNQERLAAFLIFAATSLLVFTVGQDGWSAVATGAGSLLAFMAHHAVTYLMALEKGRMIAKGEKW